MNCLESTQELATEIIQAESNMGSESDPNRPESSRWLDLVSRLVRRLQPVNNSRRFLRLPMKGEATVELPDGQVTTIATTALANKGIGFAGDMSKLAPGTVIRVLSLRFAGREYPQQLVCRIVWGNKDTAGAEFVQPMTTCWSGFDACYRVVWREFLAGLSQCSRRGTPQTI